MKVCVNADICAGFGLCIGIAPEVFELHDDGYAVVMVSEVQPEDEDMIRSAARQCPAQAITLGDDPTVS
ncbi:ferredoxin [Sphingomonas ginsenosidivorax]|uniref:Ferredoxin n=1 Tax=Sphingomonas ginsenosidivorax TaxID=862135 RepID=A0A5C6UDP4_9SPHN|nr:ferredoxin [Sphingomonas ginsenosidivorax]TXC70246.1 ferredoxin [Sphingomonas ginsenosidivorax]